MNGKKVGLAVVLGVAAVVAIAAVAVLTTRNSQDVGKTEMQRALRVLENMPVIDGHNDFPWNLRKLVANDLSKVNFNSDLTQVEPWKSHPESFTDIPRLREGRVGGQFWVAYTSCESNYKDSVSQTLEQIDVIKRLAVEYKDYLYFATSAADIETAIAQGKIASLIAVEGGHSIQSSLAILRLMYELGARYMTLTHSCNLPWADASPVDRPDNPLPPVNGGLSEFGQGIIEEMNRIGMMIDLSHVSVETMNKSLEWSKAPVIFSHSSAKAVCDHHRNVPDEILKRVAVNNGIVMVNFFSSFVQCNSSVKATIQDVVEHINHIKETAGVDHVGIGADFDGVDSVPEGLEDVSKYPALFEALVLEGWSDEDLEKLAGRNLIRVFKEVEKVRDDLSNTKPKQDTIKKADIERAGISLNCITSTFPEDVVVKNHTETIVDTPDEGNSTVRNKRHISFSPEEESAEL